MSLTEPGLALRLCFPAGFDRKLARTALWSHPGIVGPTNNSGNFMAPQLAHIPWNEKLRGKTDPFGADKWVRVITQGCADTLTFFLDARDLAAYGLRADAQCEGRARLWWERYLAEVAFSVHARTPIIEAHTGFVSALEALPQQGISLRHNPHVGLEFVARTPPTLDTSEVRTLTEKFMCLDVAPAQIEATADRLEARWIAEIGWEQLPESHPLARAWEILSVLTSLHDGGVLPEDGPAMLRLLDAAPSESEAAFTEWRSYLRTIDPDARFERICEVYMPPSSANDA